MSTEPESRTPRIHTMMTLRQRIVAMSGLVLILGGVGALLPLDAGPREPRDVVVVVRKMAFYLGEDRRSPNPPIRVAPGERIRLTLISEDSGFSHEFAVDAWRLRTSTLHGDDRTSVIFQAPDKPGTADYVCARHAAMMKGTIEVTSFVASAH